MKRDRNELTGMDEKLDRMEDRIELICLYWQIVLKIVKVCIAFIISYICDYSYADFLSHFISDVKQNDAICYKFIVEHMNKVS